MKDENEEWLEALAKLQTQQGPIETPDDPRLIRAALQKLDDQLSINEFDETAQLERLRFRLKAEQGRSEREAKTKVSQHVSQYRYAIAASVLMFIGTTSFILHQQLYKPMDEIVLRGVEQNTLQLSSDNPAATAEKIREIFARQSDIVTTVDEVASHQIKLTVYFNTTSTAEKISPADITSLAAFHIEQQHMKTLTLVIIVTKP